MKYKENEVLDILKLCCDNPDKVLLDWNINKANTPVPLDLYDFFVYSFPVIVDNEEVATITIASLYGRTEQRPDLMHKYFGHEDYNKSYWEFSQDTYLDCYFTHHKEFKLPKLVKGMYGQEFIGKDSAGNEFEFSVSYGIPSKEGYDYLYENWINDGYRFDNGVNIKVGKIKEGWSLGNKINKNIKERVRDQKIENLIK